MVAMPTPRRAASALMLRSSRPIFDAASTTATSVSRRGRPITLPLRTFGLTLDFTMVHSYRMSFGKSIGNGFGHKAARKLAARRNLLDVHHIVADDHRQVQGGAHAW